MLNKILITLITLMICSPAFCFESYFAISDFPIINYTVKNPTILLLKRNVTINNDRTTLILTPTKEGKTSIDIVTENKTESFDIEITDKETVVKDSDNITFFKLEKPTVPIIIDEPPLKLGGFY